MSFIDGTLKPVPIEPRTRKSLLGCSSALSLNVPADSFLPCVAAPIGSPSASKSSLFFTALAESKRAEASNSKILETGAFTSPKTPQELRDESSGNAPPVPPVMESV